MFFRKIIFEKQWIFLDAAIGELYGSTFELDAGGKLCLRKPKNTEEDSTGRLQDIGPIYVVNVWESDVQCFTVSSFHFAEAKEAGQDNRHIVDDGKSQKLTRDDIESLKEQGMKGQVCVPLQYFGELGYAAPLLWNRIMSFMISCPITFIPLSLGLTIMFLDFNNALDSS